MAHHPLHSRYFDSSGLRLHALEAAPKESANTPPVILCHGMPGLAYSWRHQLSVLAGAGYHAIAIDQRGYGRSDRPAETNDYSSEHTVADLVAITDQLGADKAIFVGQDFGAAQVYNMAIRHPERTAAVVGMSCPYDFDFSGRGGAGHPASPLEQKIDRPFARPDCLPSECFAAIAQHQFFYAHYYQTLGPAEAEFSSNPKRFLRRLFWALSGQGRLLDWTEYPADVQGYSDVLAEPEMQLPWPWMSEADFQYYVDEFMNAPSGLEFIGGLSAYRVADLNWRIGAHWVEHNISPPSLFIAGAQDPVIEMIDPNALPFLKAVSEDLRGIHLIDGAGHFVQQEQPAECNKLLLNFLETLV